LLRATTRLRRTLWSRTEHASQPTTCCSIWTDATPGSVSSTNATWFLRNDRQSIGALAMWASVPTPLRGVPETAAGGLAVPALQSPTVRTTAGSAPSTVAPTVAPARLPLQTRSGPDSAVISPSRGCTR
jgi:hypothetical protein